MKKLLFIFLCSSFCFAQKVTSYRNGFASENNYQVPLTYSDYSEAIYNVQMFLQKELSMSFDDDWNDKDVKGNDTIIAMKFNENGFNKNFGSLILRQYCFYVDGTPVFDKVEITGDIDIVLKFWAYFWTTNPKFNYSGKTGLIAENYFISDKIQFFRTKKGAKILVTNTVYNPTTFRETWSKWKKEDAENKIIHSETNKIELKKNDREQKTYPKQTSDYTQISFLKNKNGFTFSKPIYKELENQIKIDFADDKNGNYTAFYDVFLLDGVPDKLKLKARLNR